MHPITTATVRRFEPLWDQLTTVEQERFIRVLIAEVGYDGHTQTVTVGFHSEGIKELVSDEQRPTFRESTSASC
jgi:hypothetical protein